MSETSQKPRVHPTAIVDPECELGSGADVGPWCVITGRVRIGAGVRLIGNVYIQGPCEVGENTIIYPFTSVGFPPQDFKFKIGDATAGVVIGADCIIRESVTVHASTRPDVPTRIGRRVFMMASSHVGHDGQIGNNVVMVNASLVGGHGQVGDGVMMGGSCAIHQFVRVGRLAFLTGLAGTSVDVPPFCTLGSRNAIHTINLVGMRRSGMPREHITGVRDAFWNVLRQPLPRQEVIERLRERGRDCPPVLEIAEFIAQGKRGFARGLIGAPREEEPV
jgi:UDP-N-acetylglucosamine acyltransferase